MIRIMRTSNNTNTWIYIFASSENSLLKSISMTIFQVLWGCPKLSCHEFLEQGISTWWEHWIPKDIIRSFKMCSNLNIFFWSFLYWFRIFFEVICISIRRLFMKRALSWNCILSRLWVVQEFRILMYTFNRFILWYFMLWVDWIFGRYFLTFLF